MLAASLNARRIASPMCSVPYSARSASRTSSSCGCMLNDVTRFFDARSPAPARRARVRRVAGGKSRGSTALVDIAGGIRSGVADRTRKLGRMRVHAARHRSQRFGTCCASLRLGEASGQQRFCSGPGWSPATARDTVAPVWPGSWVRRGPRGGDRVALDRSPRAVRSVSARGEVHLLSAR